MTQFDSYKDEEEQTDHTRTWVGLIGGSIVMMFAMWRLATRLNYKMRRMRSHFRSGVKRMLIVLIILALVFAGVFIILNLIGKKKEYDEHFDKDKDQT